MKRETLARIMPTAASWGAKGFPFVEVSSRFENNKWKTQLLLAGEVIVERYTEEEQDNVDLIPFADSLKWRFGQKIEVAKGVHISSS